MTSSCSLCVICAGFELARCPAMLRTSNPSCPSTARSNVDSRASALARGASRKIFRAGDKPADNRLLRRKLNRDSAFVSLSVLTVTVSHCALSRRQRGECCFSASFADVAAVVFEWSNLLPQGLPLFAIDCPLLCCRLVLRQAVSRAARHSLQAPRRAHIPFVADSTTV